MKKQCVVIGLGKYGLMVAKKLSEAGMDILAIDKDMKRVEKANAFATKAICVNVNDVESLEKVGLEDFEYGVVGIGENPSSSILASIILKDAGVDYIIAKAENDTHKKVLERLGVNEVIIPEEDLGMITAKNILNKEVE